MLGARVAVPWAESTLHGILGTFSAHSIPPPGPGQLLEANGIIYDDIEVRYLCFTESSAALTDRSIEGAIFSVGYPAAAVLEATTTGGAQLLPTAPDLREALPEQYSSYDAFTIPGGTCPGVDAAVERVGLLTWIVADPSLPDEVGTAILDIMADKVAALQQVHPIAAQIDLSTLRRSPVSLHPAVEPWLAARGV